MVSPQCAPTLSIVSSTSRPALSDFKKRVIAPGFAAEHLRVEGGVGVTFQVEGDCHYLALHDMTLSDGEIAIDGGVRSEQRDLRNTLSYLPPGVSCRGWSIATERQNALTAIYFHPSVLFNSLEGRFKARPPDPFVYRTDGSLSGTLNRLQLVLQSEAPDSLYIEALCIVAAIELLRLPGDEIRAGFSQAQLSKIYKYIEDHLSDDMNISDLANVVGVSRFYFIRAFRQATGQAPYNYVLQQRMLRATQLLKSSQTPIEIISSAVGFKSNSQFTRIFKKMVGKTPSAFRNSI